MVLFFAPSQIKKINMIMWTGDSLYNYAFKGNCIIILYKYFIGCYDLSPKRSQICAVYATVHSFLCQVPFEVFSSILPLLHIWRRMNSPMCMDSPFDPNPFGVSNFVKIKNNKNRQIKNKRHNRAKTQNGMRGCALEWWLHGVLLVHPAIRVPLSDTVHSGGSLPCAKRPRLH